ncbi:uncharacterized protein LOC107433608 [Ziziphus jujuba]|uniref:protein Downstream neighbor of Son homolog n=1 Tax=Ziziphus jujuba TaxID=326968 RepID=A0A6P4ATQ0_ZIZJJ|nr:uncharacterized protein LOC107433608 [Ziziphus jujuba]XP_015900392.1 uncharacterized protein LOC107433608 [Ziziphus jujuba]
MAKVAPPSYLPTTSLQIGGARKVHTSTMVKRKTPSELREEQLKRKNTVEIIDESPAPMSGSISETNSGPKKPELSRNPKYIDMRMDGVYPAKKSRFGKLSGKGNVKESVSMEQQNSLKNLTVLSNLAAKKRDQLSCKENSAEVAKDDRLEACQATENCSQSTFRSVTELSMGDSRLSGFAAVNMDKALKGLAARKSSVMTGLPANSSERDVDHTLTKLGSFCLPGQKAPLDFTLKTHMRVVSSSPVTWIHRSIMYRADTGMPCFTREDQSRSHNSGLPSTSPVLSSKILHSWVYPQSILPPSLISVLTSSASQGVELDFLRRRQLAWEDSFRSLYYMLRNGICNIFYVCTPHFVAMFNGHPGLGRTKCVCKAYVSQSTRGLRSLLREHDVCFSMPRCRSKVEQDMTEDLAELLEIEKQNLGQTVRLNSSPDIDSTPDSLLVFNDNKDVHGLYDILLNYRSFLTAFVGMDVPVLYSPVPFQNASFSTPEVKFMELKRSEQNAAHDRGSKEKDGELMQSSSSNICSSVEIKDSFIPPWIICSICSVLGSEGRSFEASFTTEPTTTALNAAVEAVCEISDGQAKSGEGLQESSYSFGIPEAIVTPHLRSAPLQGLKYSSCSYMATLSPV